MKVADILRKVRIEKKYTQEDIAEVLETTQQQYSRYELGIYEIPVRHVITLCRFYGVSADYLLGLKDQEEA